MSDAAPLLAADVIEYIIPDHKFVSAAPFTAEQRMLGTGFQVIIHDLDRPVGRPDADGLALVAFSFYVGDVAVLDLYIASVGGDASALALGRTAVNVHTIELDVVRDLLD